MRKLFFFKSSASSNGNSYTVPPQPNNEKVYWENPWESDAKNQENDKVHDSSQSSKDLVFGPVKLCTEKQGFVTSGLRRSLSFSSSNIYSDPREMNLNDLSVSPSTSSNAPHHAADYPICCRSLTPERHPKPKRGGQAAIQKPYGVEKLDSPTSPRGYVDSSWNSHYSSPVPLKCRSARLTRASNKVLDLYIDGAEQEKNLQPKSDCQRISPSTGNDGCFMENRKLPSSMRLPQVQSTAPPSPTCKKESLRSSSFREVRNAHRRHSTRDWTRDDARPGSSQKLTKNIVERLSHVFPRKHKINSQDLDCETTTTVQDIFEDYSEPQPTLSSNGTVKKDFLSEHMSLSDDPYEIPNGYSPKEIPGFRKQSYFHGVVPVGLKHESFDLDAELRRKGREAEEKAKLLSEELEQVKFQNSSFSVSALFQMIRKINDDRRNLALELSSQIQSQIAERASASEAIKLANVELDSQARKLEKEKNELQISLEKELDRWSSDWLFKIEKYQSEEERLRERVRELAEKNVLLQREVSSFNSKEEEARNRIMHSELQLHDLIERMENAKGDNHKHHRPISELKEQSKGLEADRDCVKRNYKEKEKENKELQKTAARLQRICGEQEKTISGLRQGLGGEIGKQSSEKSDLMAKLQMEQVRLTGVEQVLRREIESYKFEVDSLRHENIDLFNCLQGTGNGVRFSSFKLDQELCAQVEFLQNQCFLLLNESSQLSGNLMDFVKTCHITEIPGSKQGKEIRNGLDGYLVVEYDMKFQNFKRGFDNLRRSLQLTSNVLQEKSELDAPESQPESTEGGLSGHPKFHPLKVSWD
ncbi:uncharacterized protein LOC143880933 [Tasmannia lanceolata]|uniref:uncharacterized protein LOC143880933 n=1 Tax=Tasmannia lanceolata TaxID=3420 RepID=UPI004062E12F